MKNFEVKVFASAADLAAAVAGAWLDEIEEAHRAARTHTVALSGGRIVRQLFSSTVEQAKARRVSFEHVHFFWADERCLPPSDPESNFRMARELLFIPLGIPENQIHRVRGEDPPEKAAELAEADLRRHAARDEAGRPVLDLIQLGMGEDGHVASLFPGQMEEGGGSAMYRAVKNSPKPPPNRVTLTYPAIVAARKAWVLASGSGKEGALRESLAGGGGTPLGRVLQLRGRTTVFTDIPLS